MGILQIEIPEINIQRLQMQATQRGLSFDNFVLDLVQTAGNVESGVTLSDAQEKVSKCLTNVNENFDNLSLRLSAGTQLQNSLRALELAARKDNFRLLSRVAAVLYDTLKRNPIEGFSREQLTAFQKACQEAIKIDPMNVKPRISERHLFRARLSWLPSLPASAFYNADSEEE